MAPTDGDIAAAIARFDEAAGGYARIRAAADAAVTREEWTLGPRYELDPLAIAYAGLTPGRILTRPPARIDGRVRYGFDDSDRLVVARTGTSSPGRYVEEFVTYEPSAVVSATFAASDAKGLINVTVRALHEGRVERVILVGQRGIRISDVQDTPDGRVRRIERAEIASVDDPAPNRFHTEAQYAHDGSLATLVNVFPNGHRDVRFTAR